MFVKILVFGAVFIAAAAAASIWYFGGAERPGRSSSRSSIYDYSFTSIEGAVVPLASFRGKYMLLVNVASECGFTPQYEELEKLSRQYQEKLVVIGFPTNDFMGEEPGTNEEIKSFCSSRFGVTFALSEKISVVGSGTSAIYRWLSERSLNGWNDKPPRWNFYKYLVTPDGELARVFPSTTTPLSEQVTAALR